MDQLKNNEQNDQNEQMIDENELSKSIEQEKLSAIEIELQEIEVKMDQLEIKISTNEDNEQYINEYYELKDQYNQLLKQKKAKKKASKTNSASNWDQLQPWILIYGIIVGILCLPFIGMIIWSSFASWFTSLFSGLTALQNVSHPLFVTILLLIYYSLPLILLLASWILYLNVVRDGFERKVFKYIWIGQGVLTLGNALLLFFQYIIEII